ncbi:hypothetical protein DIU36_24540 [Mucilaginibacter rubeus]|nr:hypothetical protein DIU36_24540 [Mucilaginibacter rubeus]
MLNINSCFYSFKNRKTGNIHPHYDIPAKRKKEIELQCDMVSSKEISLTIKKYVDSIYNKNV